MHKVEKPSGLAKSMVVEKLRILACCAWSVSLSGISLVYHHIIVVEKKKKYANVATTRRCDGLD